MDAPDDLSPNEFRPDDIGRLLETFWRLRISENYWRARLPDYDAVVGPLAQALMVDPATGRFRDPIFLELLSLEDDPAKFAYDHAKAMRDGASDPA